MPAVASEPDTFSSPFENDINWSEDKKKKLWKSLLEETVTSVLTVIDAEDDGGSEERSQVLAQQVGGNHLHSLQLSRDCQGYGDSGVQVATAHSLRSFKY